jgi:hypothetical protein
MLTYAPVAAAEAAACLARHATDLGQAAGLDAQKVQNLLFLCQGYSLAAHGAPLFGGDMWAAPGGVSCPAAAEPHEAAGFGNAPAELGEVVARVWSRFGDLTGTQLSERVAGHVRCVQELNGGGADLSRSPETLAGAFRMAVRQGMI